MSRGILVVIIRRLLCLENKSNLHLCIIVVLSEIKVPQKDIFLFRKKNWPRDKNMHCCMFKVLCEIQFIL